MLDDLTQLDWIVIIAALALGYGAVRYLLASAQDRSTGIPKSKNHEPKPSTPRPWHEVLGVSPDASFEEIKIAYTLKISQYQTEKVTNLGPEFAELAARKLEEIRAAYAQAARVHASA